MDYLQFNKQILQFYRDQTWSSFCHLGISLSDFESIIPIYEVANFLELRRPWSLLLKDQTTEPLYFGLLAVQCLAVSLMEDDEEFTNNAYQVRLMRLLGITSKQRLQQQFREEVDGLAVQVILWESARNYFALETGRQLSIPLRSDFRGRFVNYPLSQALLRKQDLKNFTSIFSQFLQVGENISLTDFYVLIYDHLDLKIFSRRTVKVLTERLTKEAAIRQVFSYFLTWDGSDETSKVKTQVRPVISQQSILVLRVRNGRPDFFSFPDMQPIDWQEVRQRPSFHSMLWIFNAHEYYQDEFEEARFLLPTTSCWLILDKRKWPNLYLYFASQQQSQIALNDHFVLFYLDKWDEVAATELQGFVASERPARFIGGMKAGRSRVYFEGYGPYIECQESFVVFHNEKRCVYDPAFATAGVYSVRTAHFRDAEFIIIPPTPVRELISSRCCGWNLKTMSISVESNIEGVLWYETPKEETMNNWLKLQAGDLKARKVKYVNPLFQVLANYDKQDQ